MKDGFELTESYGLPHTCEQDRVIQDMKPAKCKYCLATNLFCLKVEHKYIFVNSNGTKHICDAYPPYMKDWAEAKRMDYAFEKAWVNSHPDGHQCKKCKGKSYTSFLSRSKKVMTRYCSTEPIEMRRSCKKCKGLGVFTNLKKKDYLKELRKYHWPYKSHHKWKKADKGF
jgi:hypothetical protein